MNNKKRWLRTLIILSVIASCILIFHPRQSVIGGLGGFWGPGKTAYREDYTCIGFNFIVPPPLYTADGDPMHLCFGIITNRACTIETVNADDTITRTPVACRD